MFCYFVMFKISTNKLLFCYVRNLCTDIVMLKPLTTIKEVKCTRSTAGLPLLAGYSQSTSRPSNDHFLRRVMALWMNWARDCCVVTISVKGPDPTFQPPTASKVFRAGFRSFSLWNRSYLENKRRNHYLGNINTLYEDICTDILNLIFEFIGSGTDGG